jgi:Cu/Ag efflux protein CusF
MRTRSFALACVVVLGIALGACKAQPTSGTGQATIVAIDPVKNEITLDHGEIPDLMGAMTMTFAVSDPKLLEGLAQGRAIEFDVTYENGTYVVNGIRAR